jgi:hypothetical protein
MSFFGLFGGKKPKPAQSSRSPRSDSPRIAPPTEAELLVKAKRQREPERPQDQALSAMAKSWHDALPRRQRPTQLCKQFPRIANRLALCWNDAALVSRLIDDLVMDKRPGRAGFPAGVSQELLALRDLRQSGASSDEGPASTWDAKDMSMQDRDRNR